MKFIETTLKGAYLASIEPNQDNRGLFERLFCKNELASIGLTKEIVQINHSVNKNKGTVRGLHFQKEPFSETKIIKCIHGSVFDIIVDLRKNSETFLKWHGIELSENNNKMIIIPEGFAHGFQTLENDSELIYFHTNFYKPEFDCAFNIKDPLFNIKLPLEITEISEKDKNHKLIENIEKNIPNFTIVI